MLTCFKPPCFKTTMLQNHHASNHHASSSWPMSKVTYKKTQIPTHANRAHAIVLHLHTVRLQICSWPMDPRPLPWQGAWGQSWYVGMQAALLALRGMLLPPVLSYALRRLSLGFARSWDVPQPTPLLMGVFLFVRSAMREYTCLWHTHTHTCASSVQATRRPHAHGLHSCMWPARGAHSGNRRVSRGPLCGICWRLSCKRVPLPWAPWQVLAQPSSDRSQVTTASNAGRAGEQEAPGAVAKLRARADHKRRPSLRVRTVRLRLCLRHFRMRHPEPQLVHDSTAKLRMACP